MAKLTTEKKDKLFAEIMSKWSSDRTPVSITKAQGRALIDLLDSGLESAEQSIVAAIPNGPGKTWLVNNTNISRKLLELVAKTRTENL